MSRLSVCLITKNEEAHLERCLRSLQGLWDELVIADTGSTDRTAEIAHAFGARLLRFTWQDDFSLARNFVLDHATGDWILSIDADETINRRDHAAIRAQIARPDLDAVTVAQRHYLAGTVIGWQPGSGGYEEGEPYPGYLDSECRRLFRRRPWLRWANRVHEVIVTTDPARPIVHIPGGWVIHHFGKVGDRAVLRGKAEHYLRILQKKAAEQPRDPQTFHELGVQHGELRNYEEALEAFRRVNELQAGYSDTQLQVAICLVGLGRHDEALAVLREARATLPHLRAEVALAEGNLLRDLGRHDEAEGSFRRALSTNAAYGAASLNLALLLQAQGRDDEALTCAAEGLEINPKQASLRTLQAQLARARARALLGQRRVAEAARCLALLEGTDDADAEALRGAAALASGRLDEAIIHLRRSLEREPTQEALINLTTALRAAGGAPAVARHPGQALTIYFHQAQGAAYDGTTPRTKGLGGTESAVVYLAEALTRRGHRVAVFNTCEQPCEVEGVEYARASQLAARCAADAPDVVVAVRDFSLIGRLRLAPRQIFWTLDASDQPFLQHLRERQRRAEVDLIVVGSDWQAQTFTAEHRVAAWQMVQVNNGSAASASTATTAAPPPAATRGRRLAYASTPFRGLDVLLEVFPRIRAQCPDAELDVFSSMRVYGWDEQQDKGEFGALYAKARQPGVNLVGTVPQLELARRLQEARALAYPNTYAETFCIAAIEAQAAGCVVLTTALGALPQTVGDGGICLPGDPRSRAYQDAFVAACVRLLTDDVEWRAASSRALTRAWTDYTWDRVAERWEGLCRPAAAELPILDRITAHLANGRGPLAQRMLQGQPRPAHVPEPAWDALQSLVDWRAGAAGRPQDEVFRLVACHFRAHGLIHAEA